MREEQRLKVFETIFGPKPIKESLSRRKIHECFHKYQFIGKQKL
jgi:hypothetical protein